MGPDGYLRFILALVFVIGLIGLLAYIARRMGFGFPASVIKSGSARRIGVIEVAPLDPRRKLILIRRDDVEHLVIVSPTSETVVERNIRSGGSFLDALEDVRSADEEPTK